MARRTLPGVTYFSGPVLPDWSESNPGVWEKAESAEAPGANEDATGRPFVGQAGQLLTKILAAINLNRDEVFITNVLKHRPPGNRNPLPDEVAPVESVVPRLSPPSPLHAAIVRAAHEHAR